MVEYESKGRAPTTIAAVALVNTSKIRSGRRNMASFKVTRLVINFHCLRPARLAAAFVAHNLLCVGYRHPPDESGGGVGRFTFCLLGLRHFSFASVIPV
jgi:hypothetical protein